MQEGGQSTKDRILDTAERLFGQVGLDATSLRSITTEAGVNLAAVNYHFQTKDALLRAVLARRIGPMNQRRIALLDELEARNEPVPIPDLLHAFLRPVLELADGCPPFVPVMARLYTEQRDFVEQLFREHFGEVAQRFLRAFARALPQLPPDELMWRIHFLIGAMAHALAARRLLHAISQGACDPTNIEGLLARLIVFFTAGFEAPVPEVLHAH